MAVQLSLASCMTGVGCVEVAVCEGNTNSDDTIAATPQAPALHTYIHMAAQINNELINLSLKTV